VLHLGKVHQIGTPEDIYERPATRFVADFIGRNNVIEATVQEIAGDSAVVQFADGAKLQVRRPRSGFELRTGARVAVCLRAESIQLVNGSGLFSGVIADVEYSGPVRLCIVKTAVGNLRVEIPSSEARLNTGQQVALNVAASAVHVVAL